MRVNQTWVSLGTVSLAFACFGCSSAELQPEQSGLAPSTETASTETTETTGVELFRGELESGVVVTVLDFGPNMLGMSVGGPIGVASPDVSWETLPDIAEALKSPAPDVRERLVAIRERALAVDEIISKREHAAEVGPVVEQTHTSVDKTFNAFHSTLCRDFGGGAMWMYDYTTHWYGAGANASPIYTGYQYRPNDRSYVWNGNDCHLGVWWGPASAPFHWFVWPTIPEFWWTWFSATWEIPDPFRVSTGRQGSCGIPTVTEETGVTRHRRFPVVK